MFGKKCFQLLSAQQFDANMIKFGENKNSCARNPEMYFKTCNWKFSEHWYGVSGSYGTCLADFEVILSILKIVTWVFFTWNTICEKIIKLGESWWGRQFFFDANVNFLNNNRFSSGKDVIRFLKEIWDPKLTYSPNFFNSYMCFIPSRPPQNTLLLTVFQIH